MIGDTHIRIKVIEKFLHYKLYYCIINGQYQLNCESIHVIRFHFGVLMFYIYLSMSKSLQIVLPYTYKYNQEHFIR